MSVPNAGTFHILSVALLFCSLCTDNTVALDQGSNSTDIKDGSYQLPDNVEFTMTLYQSQQTHVAHIKFNKSSLQSLNDCLCKDTTYACKVYVAFKSGSDYVYVAQNSQTEMASSKECYKTKYVCTIAHFPLLPNNNGGNISCIRINNKTNMCPSVIWSLQIGSCKLGTADFIWQEQCITNWSCSQCPPESIKLSNCTNDTSRLQNCSYLDIPHAPERTSSSSSLTSDLTSTLAANLMSDNLKSDGGMIGGIVTAVVVVAVVLLVAGLVIWKRRTRTKERGGNIVANNVMVDELSKHSIYNCANGTSVRTEKGNPSNRKLAHPTDMELADDCLRNKDRVYDGRESTTSSCYAVIGSEEYENENEDNTVLNTIPNNSNIDLDHRIQQRVHNNNSFKDNSSSDTTNNNNNNNSEHTVVGDGDVSSYSKFGDGITHLHNPYNKLRKRKENAKLRQKHPIPADTLPSSNQEPSRYSLAQPFQVKFSSVNRPIEIVDVSPSDDKSDKRLDEKKSAKSSTICNDYEYPSYSDISVTDDALYFVLEKEGDFSTLSEDNDGTFPEPESGNHSYPDPDEGKDDGSTSQPDHHNNSDI